MFQKVCFALISIFFVVACGKKPAPGSPEAIAMAEKAKREQNVERVVKTVEEIPDWYSNPKCQMEYVLCSTATATSLDLQMAVDKATLDAKAATADKLTSLASGKMKRFREEIGAQDDPQLNEQASRVTSNLFVDVDLSGYRTPKQEVQADGGRYRAYVLVEYPIGEANKLLMDAVRRNKELETRFRASDAYRELEEDVKRYRESR
jgi:hypothetical protein